MEDVKSTWGNRFIISAIVQGGIITMMALSMVGAQAVFTKVNMIQFLSLSFEGPAKWVFLGLMFYLILIVAIAVTAVFYNHLEINLKRSFSGKSKILAWIHLIGMNVGGTGTTLLMIFAGLSGSGVMDLFTTGEIGKSNFAVMDSFIPPIGLFIGFLAIGVMCGGLTYTMAYLRKQTSIQ
ncbi:MAG: hypothetical protein EPO63_06715 [Candidatus Nitrosotenuis sp.]|nr:MAG: hypothetical protein EPO63_06715 [Candidatus Nitrosotenuis sp.]